MPGLIYLPCLSQEHLEHRQPLHPHLSQETGPEELPVARSPDYHPPDESLVVRWLEHHPPKGVAGRICIVWWLQHCLTWHEQLENIAYICPVSVTLSTASCGCGSGSGGCGCVDNYNNIQWCSHIHRPHVPPPACGDPCLRQKWPDVWRKERWGCHLNALLLGLLIHLWRSLIFPFPCPGLGADHCHSVLGGSLHQIAEGAGGLVKWEKAFVKKPPTQSISLLCALSIVRITPPINSQNQPKVNRKTVIRGLLGVLPCCQCPILILPGHSL